MYPYIRHALEPELPLLIEIGIVKKGAAIDEIATHVAHGPLDFAFRLCPVWAARPRREAPVVGEPEKLEIADQRAAFEPRVKACIALSGPYDWAEAWDGLPPLTREAFRVRSHKKTMDEAGAHAATLSLEGIASRIRCPLYVVAGKLDRIVPWRHAERLAKEASGPVEFLLVEDGNHVVNNRGYRYRTQTADWMAEQLGARGG